MMARAREITAKIGSLDELRQIVIAIRAMAAAQMQQSQNSLEPVRRYIEIIRSAVAEATALATRDSDDTAVGAGLRPGLVAFGAEHGFCGGFNEPIIKAAGETLKAQPNLYLIFVGNRGAQRSVEHNLQPDLTVAMATHSGAVSAAARRVAAVLYGAFVGHTISSTEALYMRIVNGHELCLHRVKLLPLEPLPAMEIRRRLSPLINLEPGRLRDELAAEYMFAMLEAIAMESFASENAARFRTMVAAHENIERKSSELNQLARRIRQEAVTAEILELIGGAEAMNDRGRADRRNR
jgi:F-type H+-transporting ATPase subunit gamma